ncbi:MAG: hypothetical protein R3332_10920 [Pseudohongiellaceae bacterium]|nr:hypothetical protein [Pseudohongiellaceae bacterium]
MKFSRKSLALAIAATGLSLSAMSAFASPEPSLTAVALSGGNTQASFSGGATTDNSDTFATTVDSATAFDVVATINVDPADVGQDGGRVAVISIPGMGIFQMVSGGLFLPWDGQASSLVPYSYGTLPSSEQVTILEDMVASYSNLHDLSFDIFLGYYANSIDNLVFTSTPISFATTGDPETGGDAACPSVSVTSDETFEGKTVCELSGTITQDTRLTANNVYLLNGAVFVGGDNTDSATLTIDPGTKVISPVGLNFLVINRGSKIVANGTSSKPIIFTYDDEANATESTTGRWGGLIINGNAPVNGCTEGTELCELEGEGSTGKYGGNDPEDSSGVLNYVIVKYPGQNITETNELNGIAFQAVGSGTVVNYVQVHGSSDDGVEFFGGTVNVKHLILTSNEDDSFDWTFGFQGKVQHAIIKQRPGTGDRGIEADNNEFAFDAAPRSKPSLANFTFIGKGEGGRGMEIRRGTGVNISNFVVTGHDDYCLDIDDDATFTNGGSTATDLTGDLTIRNSLFACANAFNLSDSDPWSIQDWFEGQADNTADANGSDLSGFINGPAINAMTPATFSDSFFDQVDHIGAVANEASDWASSWMFTD